MTQLNRKLPLGIQDFEEMRRDHYIYADKTDMVWKLANGTKYNYLSRPRRFCMILPIMLHKESSQVSNAIQELKISMLAANIDRSILCLKQLVAGTPYSTQKKENFVFEEHFRFILKNIFYLCGFKVSEEQQMSAGRIDLVVETSENIYILELKMSDNGGAVSASHQIVSRHYADAYAASSKPVISLALEFDRQSRGVIDWKKL